MDAVHLHLLLNHVPVIGAVFGVLVLAAAVFRRNDEWLRVGLALFVVSAATAAVVYLTGEPVEEAVEHLAGISEPAIERHEDAALAATLALGVFGLAALASLVAFRGRRQPRWLGVTALALSLVPTALMGWTANLGGQIRHSEIRRAGADPAAATLIVRRAALGPLAAFAFLSPARGAAQERDHARDTATKGASRSGREIPRSLREEHAELHARLVAATKAPGRVGESARAVAVLLHPHFVREEQIALPPLGLLRALADGHATADMSATLPLIDSLKAELPRMLTEHMTIGVAVQRLARDAKEARHVEAARLAEEIRLHALTEEEVLYPAAVLVGELVRARSHRWTRR